MEPALGSAGMASRRGSPTLHPPDPEPAQRLRLLLKLERHQGTPFPAAWKLASWAVLDSLTPHDAESWSKVFASTRQDWRAAYLRAGGSAATLPAALEALQDAPGERLTHRIVA